ncbi:MAG TPA: outer membrane beta-barrel protein [Vicinamibacterales bacterium]|nr:outer membrane beta-barrel protein [Vicinamibacterales bacterium]
MRLRSALVTGACAFAASVIFTSPAAAQEHKGDVAFSYSILHDSDLEETLPKGWSVAVNSNLNSTFGIVGEVGGNYKTMDVFGSDLSMSVHSFLGGVRARREAGTMAPFAQVLAGMARASASYLGESEDATEFAIQPGGGVDFRVTERFGLRVQGDYRIITGDETTNEFRFAVGGVLGFGSR